MSSSVDKKTDFLRFNAYSIKELITRKLAQDTKFTDQIYEGSNIAVLIDLVAYMYQCLMYQLNNAAAESMFSDTQIYENINRLVRMIGYHPQGCRPTQLRLQRNNTGDDISKKSIYPCTIFNTGLKTKKGKDICFSTGFTDSQYVSDSNLDNTTSYVLYNGKWEQYSGTLVANGTEYETFTLNGIGSDSANDKYVAFQHINVIVESLNGEFKRWTCDNNEIFIQAVDMTIKNDSEFSRIYNGTDTIYTVYLNENKEYEIKFGNGIIGSTLKKGDRLHIFYLDTNGPEGDIDIGDIDVDGLRIKSVFSSSDWDTKGGLLKVFYGDISKDDFNNNSITELTEKPQWSEYFTFYGIGNSKTEENAQQIRENAPNWFKQGNRLITKNDYEYFFKNRETGIVDVKCMNNWDYMTTFYRWLYNMGTYPSKYSDRESNPYEFIEKYRLVNNGFLYVDSADANNVYLWIKKTDTSDNLQDVKDLLGKEVNLIKTMTSETYPLKPIDVYFDISFTPDEVYYDGLGKNGDCSFDENYSYLEITMTDNSIFSNTTIKNQVADVIRRYFNVENCKIGQVVDYSVILNNIYSINGVERVRTVFNPVESDGTTKAQIGEYDVQTRHCDGISFASWTNMNELIPIGEDIQINNTSRTMEQFQFPQLSPYTYSNLENKIKVIKKTMNTTNPIKF